MSGRITPVLILFACFACRPARRRHDSRGHRGGRAVGESGAARRSPRRHRSATAAPLPTSVASPSVPFPPSSTSRPRRSSAVRCRDPFFTFFGGADDVFGSRRGVENSLGSGVIVSGDGYILTNNHVVTGECSAQCSIEQLDVTVALTDKREVPAQVVGTDPATDLALLKINARDLPTMPWGDSSKLKVAEWVLAIGNPYQLNQTVTLGIVSAARPQQSRRLDLRGLHSDRRRDQSGQLRRRAGQQPRRAGGHQHRHLQPERRLSGHRLCGVQQSREASRQRPAAVPGSAPRLDRAGARSSR